MKVLHVCPRLASPAGPPVVLTQTPLQRPLMASDDSRWKRAPLLPVLSCGSLLGFILPLDLPPYYLLPVAVEPSNTIFAFLEQPGQGLELGSYLKLCVWCWVGAPMTLAFSLQGVQRHSAFTVKRTRRLGSSSTVGTFTRSWRKRVSHQLPA